MGLFSSLSTSQAWLGFTIDSVCRLSLVFQLFNTQAESLLLMTSVAMPVFSKKEETVSCQTNKQKNTILKYSALLTCLIYY